MVEFVSRIERKARKDHTCFHCRMRIRLGTIYNNSTFAFDERIYSLKTHVKCDEKADEVDLYKYCEDEGVDSGELREHLIESDEWNDHVRAVNGAP